MAEENDQERTLPASPKRLEQARRDGNIPRSRELTTCLVLLGGGAALWIIGPNLAQRLSQLLRAGLTLDGRAAFDVAAMGERLGSLCIDALLMLLPLLLALLVATLAGPLAVGGWAISLKPVTPQLSRLNPLTGLGRIFSATALLELVKAIAKALIIGGIGAWLIWTNLDSMLGFINQTPQAGMRDFTQLMLRVFLLLAMGLVLIAAIDVPAQLYQYHAKMRMTLEEAKREARETDGDPQLKARIRAQQRETSRRRMMTQVPKADVIVTNPTHYAVALKYSDNKMDAPQVVAKGVDAVAQRIRELAAQHGVPTLEAPPLARALYRHVDIGAQIPQALYTAVAQVLAYVYQLRAFRAHGGRSPELPADWGVPADFDFAAGRP